MIDESYRVLAAELAKINAMRVIGFPVNDEAFNIQHTPLIEASKRHFGPRQSIPQRESKLWTVHPSHAKIYGAYEPAKIKKLFAAYESLLLKGKQRMADKLGAELYGYPACCQKEYTKEHDMQYVENKYTAYAFYKKLHDVDIRFPFIFHSPCSLSCLQTKELNKRHKTIIKKYAP